VACTQPGTAFRYIAAGTADGGVRLLNLDRIEDKANDADFNGVIRENTISLLDKAINADSPCAHSSAVTAIAFSPDGKLVATGGEDYAIALWEVPSGKLLARQKAHKQAITSLQIVKSVNDKGQPVVRMLSAGRDNVLTLWTLNEGKMTRDRDFDRRTGDVNQLTSDGKRFLFDQGKDLVLLSLNKGDLEGMLQNPPTAGSFTTLAMFSPDGQTILTNCNGEAGLQLWRAPDSGGRGSEVRQFVWTDGHATCAAFAPDGSFAVTGTREDHQVLVWKMPSKEEVQTPLYAKVSLVEETVESGSKHVRVWADLDTKPDWLLPGTKARMVIVPNAK
jgi:WD40 repeat protein